MTEIVRNLAASTRGQFFFVIITIASNGYLFENFQFNCYLHLVNVPMYQYVDSETSRFLIIAKRSAGCSG